MTWHHTLEIRSSYQDESVSRARLDLSRQTILPSLQSQAEHDFRVVLRVHPDDPLLPERMHAFRSTGVPVDMAVDYTAPAGPRIVTRVDDDDCIAVDFTTQIKGVAQRAGDYIEPPSGFIWERGRLYTATLKRNMFGSVVTDDPEWSIWSEHHGKLHTGRVWRRLVQPLWIWVRHPLTKTTALRGHFGKPARLDRKRFPNVLKRMPQ